MVQIIPENRKRSASERFADAFANAGERSILNRYNQRQERENIGINPNLGKDLQNLMMQHQQKEMLKNQRQAVEKFGIDPDLDPAIQKLMMQYQLMGDLEDQKGKTKLDLLNQQQDFAIQQKAEELQGQRREKAAPFRNALDTINEMKRLGKKRNLGRGSGFRSLFGGETAKDFGKYEQLGKSLISFASTIPIRNKAEFEVLAHNLYDPTIPDSQREGILDAMESIIRRNMSTYLEEDEGENINVPSYSSLRKFDRRFQQ